MVARLGPVLVDPEGGLGIAFAATVFVGTAFATCIDKSAVIGPFAFGRSFAVAA